MAADKPSQVQVEIFGQIYAIKAGNEPGYVEALAAYVDAQMRDIARGTGTVDSLRLAVLAALNIADELHRAKSRQDEGQHALQDRARGLADVLDSALGERSG